MEIHEKHCTLNPQRECRFCTIISGSTTSIEEMLKVMPNIEDYKLLEDDNICDSNFQIETFSGLDEALKKAIDKIRELSDNCPCCILATLRQCNLHMHAFKIFNYKKEVEEFWSEFNKREFELEQRSYY